MSTWRTWLRNYIFGLATTQGFADGNKRTATAAGLLFLDLNGWDVSATPDELYVTVMAVANNRMSRDALADWIRNRLVELE